MDSLIEKLKLILEGSQVYWLDFSRWTHKHRTEFHHQVELFFSNLGNVLKLKSVPSVLNPPEVGSIPIIRINSPRGLKVLGEHYKHLEYYRVPMVVVLAIEHFDDSILWQVHFISDLLDLRRHLHRQILIPLILFTTQELPLNQYEQHLVSFLGFKLVNVIAVPGEDGKLRVDDYFLPELISELLPIHLTYLLGREMVNKTVHMRPTDENLDFLMACQHLRSFLYPVMVESGSKFYGRWKDILQECQNYFDDLRGAALKELLNTFGGRELNQIPRLDELQSLRVDVEQIFYQYSAHAHEYMEKVRQEIWQVSLQLLKEVIDHLYFTDEFLQSIQRMSQYLLIPRESLLQVVRRQVFLDLLEIMVFQPMAELKKRYDHFFSQLHEHLNTTLGPIFVLEMLVANLPPWATAYLKVDDSKSKRSVVIHRKNEPLIKIHVVLEDKVVKVELTCKKHARKYKKRTFTPCIIPRDNKLDEFKVIDGQQVKYMKKNDLLPEELNQLLDELQITTGSIQAKLVSLTMDVPILFDKEQLLLLSKVLLLLAYQENPDVAHPDIRQQFRNQFGKVCKDYKW